MSKGRMQLELDLDLDAIITSEEYGTTLKEELVEVVKHEIKEAARRMARKHMQQFVTSYMDGKLAIHKDEEGNDCVMIPLLVRELKK